MLAVDTNVLVRVLVTDDDRDQHRRAVDLFRQHEILVLRTVVLETERVLRFKLGLDRKQILNAFELLARLP